MSTSLIPSSIRSEQLDVIIHDTVEQVLDDGVETTIHCSDVLTARYIRHCLSNLKGRWKKAQALIDVRIPLKLVE